MSPDTHTPPRENPRSHARQHGFSYLRDTAQTQTPAAWRDPDRHELMILRLPLRLFCDFEKQRKALSHMIFSLFFQPFLRRQMRIEMRLVLRFYSDPARAFKYGPTMWRLVRCKPISKAWSAWLQP